MARNELSCGLEFPIVIDLQTEVADALFKNYSFVVLPTVHPRFRRNYCAGVSSVGSFTRSDMLLSTYEWSDKIVGKLSSHLDVDTPNPKIQRQHEDCFNEELSYCCGLAMSAILFNIHGRQTSNLARLIHSYYRKCHHPSALWMRVPLFCKSTYRANITSDGELIDEDAAYDETWLWWTKFHERMEWDKRVGLVLELSADLPKCTIMDRWLGEPIKAVIVPTSIFQINKKGYPTLPVAHQKVLLSMIERDAQVIISGAPKFPVLCYSNYLHNLFKRGNQANLNDPMLNFAKGWEDVIQTPLQPLADNLDTSTYNVFEKDSVKYRQYQKAISQALTDLKLNEINKTMSDVRINEVILNNHVDENEEKHEKVYTVMVLGAGRGPLIRATLNAADISGTKVKIIAVEKNPCAVVVLEALVHELWHESNVKIVAGDMRYLKLSPPADIIVSELLGSWGDNELSPECLDGASGLLSPGGISIPKAYTSYAAPVTSPRLWAAAKTCTGKYGEEGKSLETLWVVYMHNKYDIAETKPIFTFEHPAQPIQDHEGNSVKDYRGQPLTDNRRKAVVTWVATQDSVMHGFGGYFDCSLYGEEMLSIVPSTHTPGMISWFPVFIPIKTPLRVHKGEEITATFWRCVSSRRVWYEWVAEVGHKITPIHNSNGKSSEMFL